MLVVREAQLKALRNSVRESDRIRAFRQISDIPALASLENRELAEECAFRISRLADHCGMLQQPLISLLIELLTQEDLLLSERHHWVLPMLEDPHVSRPADRLSLAEQYRLQYVRSARRIAQLEEFVQSRGI